MMFILWAPCALLRIRSILARVADSRDRSNRLHPVDLRQQGAYLLWSLAATGEEATYLRLHLAAAVAGEVMYCLDSLILQITQERINIASMSMDEEEAQMGVMPVRCNDECHPIRQST